MHKFRYAAVAAATAAVTAAALVNAVPAVAARPHISASASGGVQPKVASTYLAGYQMTNPGVSRATARFNVPTVTCPTGDTQGTGLGLGNEQAVGFPTVLAIVFLACVSGSPQLTMYSQAGGNGNSGTALPGDLIFVSISQTTNKVVATVRDVTQGFSVVASGTPMPDNSVTYGLFPLFAGPDPLPVADFGAVRVRQSLLENAPIASWGPTKLTRMNGAVTQVATGNFIPSGTFSLFFRSN